ncbi:hypothetical protein STENM36S_00849 [Streptomyces tendae]
MSELDRPSSEKDLPSLYDHSSAPTREKAANWTVTKTPEAIMAFWPSRRVFVASTRWTISWSEPCEAMAKIAPPMMAVGRANGLVRMWARPKSVSKSVNLPASMARA